MQDINGALEIIIELLQKAGIEYAVTGSMASMAYGHLRTTQDIDIIIDANSEKLGRFLGSIEKDFYFSRPAAFNALENRSMFNIISFQYSWKLDLIFKKSGESADIEFRRKQQAPIMGVESWILSPEDIILNKLKWSKGRESQLQFSDVQGILLAQWGRLDMDYLKGWAAKLGVGKELEDLIKQAEKVRAAAKD